MIFVIKVMTNKEDQVLDSIAYRVKRKSLNVYSLSHPHGLRGYIFLEAPDRDTVDEAIFNIPYVKGIINKVIEYSELKNLFEVKEVPINIEKNDVVEIIAEPFKKQKAKVLRIDKTKQEAVVTLLEAAVPIPVTIKLDNLRVIRREEDEQK